MDTNIQNFLQSNQDAFVKAMRAQQFVTVGKTAGYVACSTKFLQLTDEQQSAILESLGYDENAEPATAVVEPIAVPSDVTVLTFTNDKGGKSRYALLPYVRRTKSSFFVCKYGNSEVYVRLGDRVAGIVYGNRTMNEGDMITVNMEPDRFKRDTDKTSPLYGKLVSSIHASADALCQQYISYQEQNSTSIVELAREAVRRDTTGTLKFAQAIKQVQAELNVANASNVKEVIAETKRVSFADFMKNGGK